MLVAGITCAGGDAVRMKTGVLVKRDGEAAVFLTEDVATVTAVMSSGEEVERAAAFRRVTVGRLWISLLEGVSRGLQRTALGSHVRWTDGAVTSLLENVCKCPGLNAGCTLCWPLRAQRGET